MVLGIFPDNVYEQAEMPIAPGDRVVFYTDGITEARNPEGDEYGEERLAAAAIAARAAAGRSDQGRADRRRHTLHQRQVRGRRDADCGGAVSTATCTVPVRRAREPANPR